MLGAIIGNLIGTGYDITNSNNLKINYDTVMIIAITECLISCLTELLKLHSFITPQFGQIIYFSFFNFNGII